VTDGGVDIDVDDAGIDDVVDKGNEGTMGGGRIAVGLGGFDKDGRDVDTSADGRISKEPLVTLVATLWL